MQELINKLFKLNSNQLELVNEYIDKLLNPKKSRSLSQNSYSWKLTVELANKLNISKEELHFRLLQDYGQSEIISVQSSININGFFEYYKEIGKSNLNGKEFIHYKIYKPTHKMDTYEMSVFIDGLVSECENVGIPTLTAEEIKGLKLV